MQSDIEAANARELRRVWYKRGFTNACELFSPSGPSKRFCETCGFARLAHKRLENPYDHDSGPNGCADDCNACAWERGDYNERKAWDGSTIGEHDGDLRPALRQILRDEEERGLDEDE